MSLLRHELERVGVAAAGCCQVVAKARFAAEDSPGVGIDHMVAVDTGDVADASAVVVEVVVVLDTPAARPVEAVSTKIPVACHNTFRLLRHQVEVGARTTVPAND